MIIFLADDDPDDCFLFEEALKEVPIVTELRTTHDGVELMKLLNKIENLPHTLFLDLNMPLKNGVQCLEEIKRTEKLRDLEVIILSTSFSQDIAGKLLTMGAKQCMQKPCDLDLLSRGIRDVLSAPMEKDHVVRTRH